MRFSGDVDLFFSIDTVRSTVFSLLQHREQISLWADSCSDSYSSPYSAGWNNTLSKSHMENIPMQTSPSFARQSLVDAKGRQ